MAGEWPERRFERLLTEPVRNGIYKKKEFHGRGAKIVNMGELFAYPRLRAVPMKRVELSESEADRFLIARGDLLFARRSLVAEGAGKCSVVLDVNEPTTFESSIIRARPDSTKADSLFLYYFFNSPLGLYHLDTIRRQVAVAGITGGDLAKLEIAIPPPSEQRAIAHILGTLDDKIELNRQMNETLEAMARTLFKSWFVDFDPVRAKAESHDPRLPQRIADLLPDSFEETELGEIPKGWAVRAIDQLSEQVAMGPFGSSIKVETFVPEGVPVISGQHLRGTLLEDSEYNFITNEHAHQLKRSNAKRGDVVFTHAGSIGQVAYIPDTSRYERYVISQRQFYVRCNAKMSPLFLAFYFKTADGQHRLLANTSSTGVPSISRPVSYLRQLKVVVPPDNLLKTFDSIAQDILRKVATNTNESASLASLRDSLLAKLISGELRVKDVAQAAGTAPSQCALVA
jgi:type I restriction enzyme, S subunit